LSLAAVWVRVAIFMAELLGHAARAYRDLGKIRGGTPYQ
jgi:hypothetical protein